MTTELHADVEALDRRINQLGASLFFDPATIAHAADLGVSDVFALYAAGRAGVMGDVGSEQVAACLGFFPEGLVRDVWRAARAIMSPADIATIYAESMAAAARSTWDPSAAAEVVSWGGRVVDAASTLGLPLFAGWRALPRPDDAVGAAVVVVHALRELRGELHVQSVAAQGLAPLEAEVVTRGAEGAALHQWPEPWPDPAPFVDRVAAADAATNARMVRIYASSIGAEGVARLTAAVGAVA